MAKVFYLPYGNYELLSDLTKEDLIAKIRSQISNHDLIGELTSKNKREFSGSINLTTGEFKIRKRIKYRNDFNSTLRGRIENYNGKSKVFITLKLPTFAYIFITFFCVAWAYMGFSDIRTFEDLAWPLGGLAFVYVLTFFAFNMGAASALDALHELI